MVPLLDLVQTRDSSETEIVSQLERVLVLEHEMKKTRLLMALRIRNHLNDDQLVKLEELRKKSGGERRRKAAVP